MADVLINQADFAAWQSEHDDYARRWVEWHAEGPSANSLNAGYNLGPEFDEEWDVAELAAKGPAYLRRLAKAIEKAGGDPSGLEREALGVLAGDTVVARGAEFGRDNLLALGFPITAEYRWWRLEADDTLTPMRRILDDRKRIVGFEEEVR